MALKLSIFTTITNPIARGDNYKDALQCYDELADEVVEVIGGCPPEAHEKFIEPKQEKNVYYNYTWPEEFYWEFIGEQFQRGYEICTGDWVIHADLDFIFHEKDFDAIRRAIQENNNQPALSFWKYQFVQPDRYNLKSRLVIAVNKGKYGNRIRFNSGGDLCQPSLDGNYIQPNTVPEARIPFYNYEKLLKTKEQIANDQGRMERAWYRKYGKYQMGSDGTNNIAYRRWVEVQVSKMNKPHEPIPLDKHPIFVKETIMNLKPENWGFNGHGNFETITYLR